MRVAICSNVDNAKGLQRDTEILGDRLRELGHTVAPLHFIKARTPPAGSFDLCIFLEVAPERFFDCAPRRWLIPNPEWWAPAASLEPFDRVLCKTGDAERIFRQRADGGDRVGFLGFEALCRRQIADPEAAIRERPDRRLGFLHIAGGSTVKGTQAVLDAWGRHDIAAPLTVVTSVQVKAPKRGNVTVHQRVTDARLAEMQRSTVCHLQPSEYEGFGHVVHEGLSVGACVLTTDAEPMRSVDGVAELVAITGTTSMHSARMWHVSPEAVAVAVGRVVARSPDWFEGVRVDAIRAFEAQRGAFRETLAREVGAPR